MAKEIFVDVTIQAGEKRTEDTTTTEKMLIKAAQGACAYNNNGMCASPNSMSKCNLTEKGCRYGKPLIVITDQI